MHHLWTFTMPCKFSLARRAFFLVLFLLFFGAENGLASKTVIQHTIWRYSSGIRTPVRCWFIGDEPSIYIQFPFLASLYQPYSSNWCPYGTQIDDSSSPNFAPYYYYDNGQYTQITVPDSVTPEYIEQVNKLYSDLPASQKAAVTGLSIADVTHSDGITETISYFNHRSIGSYYENGVTTYSSDGDVILSYPDSTGFATGNKLLPDGSTSPVYFRFNGTSVSEVSSIPTSEYSTLTQDSQTGAYSLQIPDYSTKLDAIITRIDNIDLSVPQVNVNVSPPDVTVNPDINFSPEINVNPTVTVPAPEVTVNVPETDLSDIESSLVEIGNTLVADDHNLNLQTNDFYLSSDEQLDFDALRSWQVDIPLLGDAVDFGLNTLVGKIPNVGTEYVWLDYTVGGFRRNSKAPSSNPLNGYHIRIDLTSYRETLLAIRGWLILLEALFFSLLVYKNVREALKV